MQWRQLDLGLQIDHKRAGLGLSVSELVFSPVDCIHVEVTHTTSKPDVLHYQN